MKTFEEIQQEVYTKKCADHSRWAYYDSPEPVISYLRDRRLEAAVKVLLKKTKSTPADWENVLIVCGGVGGEGTCLANRGFKEITVSDVSVSAIDIVEKRDCRLTGLACCAENITVADESYDLVVVREGLHHLRNPPKGLTEMLRVAKKAVIILEPHSGIVTKLFGTEYENDDGLINYVFRWNDFILKQVVRSYLLKEFKHIYTLRIWDHTGALLKATKIIRNSALRLRAIKACYFMLQFFLPSFGNKMIGIVIKKDL